MTTAAQRSWVKRHREAAAREPSKYATVRIRSSIDRASAKVKAAKSKAAATGREYRGPTTEQIAAKTLAKTPISTAHRQQARTAALTQSGMRGGMLPAAAAAKAATTVYGATSAQARRAHDVLIKERQIATAKQKVIADMKRGVVSGIKVSGIPTSAGYNPRHSTQMIDPRIHVGTGNRPEIVETISENQKRVRVAYLQLQSDESKLQRSQTQLFLAEQRLNKHLIKDGKFVGTEAQYKKYLADYNKYTTKYKEVDGQINKYNTDLKKAEVEGYRLEHRETAKRRAKYGGLAGVHEDIERKVSEKIPTLEDISKKGADFRREHPKAAATIYTTFEKAHANTEHVGTQSQRNAMAGYTYGSYSSLQKQPVKTAVSFAIGGASVKAVKMAGLVGKAYGAGKWTKRMAKAAQYGLLAYYGKKSSEHIMSAPNAYVAGQRAANIMYTEVLPMAAGIKAVEVAPKVVKVTKVTAKKIVDMPVKEFNKQMRAIEIIHEVGMVGAQKGRPFKVAYKADFKIPFKLPPVKVSPKPPSILNKVGSTARTSTLSRHAKKGTLLQFVDEHSVYKYFQVLKKTTDVNILKTEIENMKVLKSLFKEQYIDGRLSVSTYNSNIKVLNAKIKMALDVKITIKHKVADVVKPKPKVKPEVKLKPLTATAMAQQVGTAGAVIQLFKQAHKQQAELKQEQLAKQKAEQKQKAALLIAQKQEAAAAAKEKLIAKKAAAEKVAPKPARKVTPKPVRKLVIKVPKLIIPPVVPLPKRKAKKKPIRKDRQIVTYTQIQLENRVATIASLFG